MDDMEDNNLWKLVVSFTIVAGIITAAMLFA